MKAGRLLLSLALAVPLAADVLDTSIPQFRWESVSDGGPSGITNSVIAAGGMLIAGGGGLNGSGANIEVHGYRMNGQLAWQDSFAVSGCRCGTRMAYENGIVAVAGSVAGTPGTTDIGIRSYDANTGVIQMASAWNSGNNDFPQSVLINNGVLYVVGYGGDVAGNTNLKGIIRAMNAGSGDVLWTSVISHGSGFDDSAWRVAADGQHIVVAGMSVGASSRSLILRAYNLYGQTQWEDAIPGFNGMPTGLEIVGSTIVVAGYSNARTYLSGFDVASGAGLWTAADVAGYLMDMRSGSNGLVAVGYSGPRGFVQTLDINGNTLWTQMTSPLSGTTEQLHGVTLTERAIYTGGVSTFQNPRGPDGNVKQIMLKVFDWGGNPIYQDYADAGTGTNGASVAAAGMNLGVVGLKTGMGSYDGEGVTRAYDISGIESPAMTAPDAGPVSSQVTRCFLQRKCAPTPVRF